MILICILFGLLIGYLFGRLVFPSVKYHGPNPNIMNKILIKKDNSENEYFKFIPTPID